MHARTTVKTLGAAAALALALPAAALAWSGSAQNYGRDWLPDDYSYAMPNTGTAAAEPGFAATATPDAGMPAEAYSGSSQPLPTAEGYGRDVSPDDYSFAIPNTGMAGTPYYGSSQPRRRFYNRSGY